MAESKKRVSPTVTTDRIIFARVGQMTFYKGVRDDDTRPRGGGRYNRTKIGHEAYNFLPVDGNLYGYFQPSMAGDGIKLRRVSGQVALTHLTSCAVVWIADGAIVGWYKGAMLYASASCREIETEHYAADSSSIAPALLPKRSCYQPPNARSGFPKPRREGLGALMFDTHAIRMVIQMFTAGCEVLLDGLMVIVVLIFFSIQQKRSRRN